MNIFKDFFNKTKVLNFIDNGLNFQDFIKILADKKYIANQKLRTADDDINKIINNYNLELKTILIHKLSVEELANIELLIENVRKHIVTWDYDNWLIKDDFVPPSALILNTF